MGEDCKALAACVLQLLGKFKLRGGGGFVFLFSSSNPMRQLSVKYPKIVK